MKSLNNQLEYELEESNRLDYLLTYLLIHNGILREPSLWNITDIRCKIEIEIDKILNASNF
jgi:hypothetical protein